MKHSEFVSILLDNACPSMPKEEAEKNEGFNRYYIEVHCRAFIVEAKRDNDNVYIITSGPMKGKQVTQGMWEIRSCTKVECKDPPSGKV